MQSKSNSKKIGFILPNQLFEHIDQFYQCEQIYLIEEELYFNQFAFHKLKIAYHRSSMKAYEAYLNEKGLKVSYVDSSDKNSSLLTFLRSFSDENILIYAYKPVDNWLEKAIAKAQEQIDFIFYENPQFILEEDDLLPFFKPAKKKFFQTSFYKAQRKRYKILISNGEPEGGKWTYDVDNRKPYPKDQKPPAIQQPKTNTFWKEAVEYVSIHFKDNPGNLSEDPLYPMDFKSSRIWLEQFLEQRFKDFGAYEDAILKKEDYLNHSVLSPMMNIGLISPKTIVNEALVYARKNKIPLNSTEGFIRQIIGWREFIRGLYHSKGTYSRTRNYWGFSKKLPKSFYDGSTGIEPVDQSIHKLLKTGYNHHIERLMILGNFMILCEFDPDEVYRWFMELYIDAYDWVMVPNVYGMSQFADGGLFATKPYISSSNYIKKMSDYKSGRWTEIWDALFWRFIDKHEEFFIKNPRLSMMVRNWHKMDGEKKTMHLQCAEDFLAQL